MAVRFASVLACGFLLTALAVRPSLLAGIAFKFWLAEMNHDQLPVVGFGHGRLWMILVGSGSQHYVAP